MHKPPSQENNQDNNSQQEVKDKRIIDLRTISDSRGRLTVLENNLKNIPFEIKRIFWIFDCNYEERGKHRHKKTVQVATCPSGSCVIDVNDEDLVTHSYLLNDPKIGLLLEPKDFHTMRDFTKDAVLMVFASEHYDPEDYIYDNYPT